jgi:long-subunit fatty acid transport protein
MRRVCFAVLCSAVLVAPAAAQSNVEVNAGVQFDFLSPGARSLAMGGAFIGNADDATAAFVNPAGLRALTRREVSFEGRGRDFSFPVTVGGRFNGTSTGRGVDTSSGPIDADVSQSSGGIAFLSFVYPQTRWSIAGYRHELAKLDLDVETQGVFFNLQDGSPTRLLPIRANMEADVVTYGVSGSFNVTPEFAIGAGLAFYDFSMDSRTNRFFLFSDDVDPPDFAADNIQNFQLQQGDDTDVAVNLGALWAPSRMFQLGAVYRQGPDFDLRAGTFAADATPTDADFRQGAFHVPHVFGVGVVYRPMTNGTLAIDIARVQHSRLADDFLDIFNADNSGAADFAVSDVTEFHAGFEYVFTRQIPVAVRTGYWYDPSHALEFVGTPNNDSEYIDSLIFRPRGDDQHHFTAGAGAVFGRFEINGGADFADRATTVSFSAVVRF